MARYRITDEDGATYSIEAPDNISLSEVERLFREQKPSQPAKPAAPKYEGWGEWLADGARSAIGQGAMLGFGDEAIAGVRSLAGADYDTALKEERAAVDRFRERNPVMSTVGELAGGMAIPGGIVANSARKGASALGTIARGAGAGAGFATVAGYGSGEGGAINRASNAAAAAPYGAAFGAAIPAAVIGARAAAKPIATAVAPAYVRARQGPEAAADLIMARRMRAAGTNPSQVRADLKEGQRSARFSSAGRANLPETIADTSDDMQRLTGSVYRAGGEGAELIEDRLTRRQRGPENLYAPRDGEPPGQLADIQDALERALEVRSKDGSRATDRALMLQQRADANRLYGQAYQQSDPFDLATPLQIARLRAEDYTGGLRRRLDAARRLFARIGYGGSDTVKRYDAAKRQLDDMIDASYAQTPSGMKATTLTRELKRLKDDLDAEVFGSTSGTPTRNLTYREARDAFGSAAENREAIEMGRNALRGDMGITVEDFRALSDGQKKLFRIGLRDAASQGLARKGPGQDAARLFSERRVIDLLREAIPASKSKNTVFHDRPQRFGDYMRRQDRMVQTRNKVLGGSPTQQRQMDDLRGAGDMLTAFLTQMRGGTNLVLEAVGSALNRVGGFTADTSAALARRLVESNPEQQMRILARIRLRMGDEGFRAFRSEMARSLEAASGGSGVMVGLQEE